MNISPIRAKVASDSAATSAQYPREAAGSASTAATDTLTIGSEPRPHPGAVAVAGDLAALREPCTSSSKKAPVAPIASERSDQVPHTLFAERISAAVKAGDDVALSKACNAYLAQSSGDWQGLSDLVQQRVDQETLLMIAAANNGVAVGQTLLNYGADPLVGKSVPKTSGGFLTDTAATPSTPMYLAALAGHGDFVTLLHQHSVPLQHAISALTKSVHPEVLRALRQAGTTGKEFKSLLDHWATHQGASDEVKLLLHVGKAKADQDTLLAAARCPNADVIGLLRDYGVDVNRSKIIEHADSNVYDPSGRRPTETLVTPLSEAITALNEAPEDAKKTIAALFFAGAKARAEDLTKLIDRGDTTLFRDGVAFGGKLKEEHLLLAAQKGELAMVAIILQRKSFSPKQLEDGADRAQSEKFARTANLIRAKRALDVLRGQQPSPLLQGLSAWLPRPWTSGEGSRASEKAQYTSVDSPEIEAAQRRLTILLAAAEQNPKDGANPAMPPPASSSQNWSVVLRRQN